MSKKKFPAEFPAVEAEDLIKKVTDSVRRINKVLARELTEEEKDRSS